MPLQRGGAQGLVGHEEKLVRSTLQPQIAPRFRAHHLQVLSLGGDKCQLGRAHPETEKPGLGLHGKGKSARLQLRRCDPLRGAGFKRLPLHLHLPVTPQRCRNLPGKDERRPQISESRQECRQHQSKEESGPRTPSHASHRAHATPFGKRVRRFEPDARQNCLVANLHRDKD